MAYQYGKYLELNGHNVEFLLIEDRVDEKYSDVNVKCIKSKSILSSIVNLRKLSFNKDTIFISLIPFYTVAFLMSRMLKGEFFPNIIYTVHNNIDFDFKDDFVSKFVKFVYMFKLKLSNNVYSVSHSLNSQLKDKGIRSSVLLNRTSHKYLSVERLISKKINFLMIGRLNPQKDYIKGMEYFNILKNKGIDFSVTIYGEGEEEGKIRDMIDKLKLKEQIEIYPYCENIESVIADDKYHALLLSSKYEGFGLVLIEAISKCMFVVGRNCHYGPAEIITNKIGHLLPYNYSDRDVLDSVNSIREHYKSRELHEYEDRYKFLLTESYKSWKKLEKYH